MGGDPDNMQKKFAGVFGAALFAVLGVLGGTAQAQTQTQKPNILVIWGDDIGGFNISAYNRGMMGYKTPNIDSIASEGARQGRDAGHRCRRPGLHAAGRRHTAAAAAAELRVQCAGSSSASPAPASAWPLSLPC